MVGVGDELDLGSERKGRSLVSAGAIGRSQCESQRQCGEDNCVEQVGFALLVSLPRADGERVITGPRPPLQSHCSVFPLPANRTVNQF